MAFRNNRDALLARADALQLENSRLRASHKDTEVELAAATAELDRVRSALATRETERARAKESESKATPLLTSRTSSSTTDAAHAQRVRAHRRRAIIVLAATLLLPFVGSALWVVMSSDGDSEPKTRAVPAKQSTAVATKEKNEETAAAQAVAKVRRCLDNGDIYLRSFLANPKHRQRNLVIRFNECIASLGNLAEPTLSAQADDYERAAVSFRPHLNRLIAFYEAKQYEDQPELGVELARRRSDAQTRWRQASNRLREDARAAIAAERSRALQRAEATGKPEIVAFVRFGGAASDFLNELATSPYQSPTLQRAYDSMRNIRLESGAAAGGDMAELIHRASRVLDAMRSKRKETRNRRVASEIYSFARKYNMARYAVPYPFYD